MFSSRTPASLELNHLTQTLARMRERGSQWMDLTVSNPTRVALPYPAREILDALGDPRALTYEPVPFGPIETREAVAHYYHDRGLAVSPGQVVLSASTSEAYGWLFKLLCEPGDVVLTPAPSYPLFECLAALDSIRAEPYPLAEELGWGIDFDALERLDTARVRALVVVNPNNPTGTFLRREEWVRLQNWAAVHRIALIVDEVFLDYRWEDAPLFSSTAGPHEALTFTLSGLSKAAGLPQMKLGWTVVNGPVPLQSEALARLEWIADSYLPVSAPSAFAATTWLAKAGSIQAAIRARCRSNLETLRAALTPETGCRVMPASAGWVATLDVPRIYSEEGWVLTLVARHGVLLQPGFFYDFPREAFLVASLLPPESGFAAAAESLKKGFRSV